MNGGRGGCKDVDIILNCMCLYLKASPLPPAPLSFWWIWGLLWTLLGDIWVTLDTILTPWSTISAMQGSPGTPKGTRGGPSTDFNRF